MSHYPDVLIIVPARAGSKRLPGKHWRLLAEKPLACHTLEFANEIASPDNVVVTTDDEKLLNLARNYGFRARARPLEMATDDSPVVKAVEDAINYMRETFSSRHKYAFLLEVTSPFRLIEDFKKAASTLRAGTVNSVATFSRSSIPIERQWRIAENSVPTPIFGFDSVSRGSHEMPASYYLNGNLYGFEIGEFFAKKNQRTVLVEPTTAIVQSGPQSLTIDTERDLELAQFWTSAV